MNELVLLQALRLKGRVSEPDLASTVGADSAETGAAVEQLTEAGLVASGKLLKLTPEGRERLADLLASERSAVDASSVAQSYTEFRSVNGDFKELVSDWQLKDGQPNDHTDAAYDDAVLARLDAVHDTVMPIIAGVAALLPRLGSYGDKLDAALARVKAGELPWLTRPIMDSYHTVWFELHEELIGAAGLTREQEANAGHAD
jgi:hypothetical protein